MEDLKMASGVVEVEFKECVRIGGTVYNGPTESKHADGSTSRYPPDRAGLSPELADIVVSKGFATLLRKDGIADTLGSRKDPWMDGRQLGLSELITRLLNLEAENAELKSRLGKRA